MKHCMIDLETLGIDSRSIILSIGAVVFCPKTGVDETKTFYRTLDFQPLADAGFKINAHTFYWWLRQSKEAQMAIDGGIGGEPPADAVRDFETFFKSNDLRFIWSHGATFDIPLWTDVCNLYKRNAPWFFTNARDTRTLYDITGYKPSKVVAHHALGDAIAQAKDVVEAWKCLSL